MGLFDKKFCGVCGGKIGLFGNRKLEDGNLCKDCAAKLSPWFSERRHSTLEDIKGQLAYREENKAAVSAFHTTRSLGRNYKVYLDEDARKFMVSSASNLSQANPDVLSYSQVTGCDLDIEEDRDEIKRKDANGNSVSYNPPRYEYSYDFYITIRVNHPYFDDMRFKLNPSRVNTGERPMTGGSTNWKFKQRGINFPGLGMGVNDYNEYVQMGNEIKEALTQARQAVRDEVIAQTAPKKAVTCPWCGATTFPDASGCCEYCGGAVNA